MVAASAETTSNGMGADEVDYEARVEALVREKERVAEEWAMCQYDPYRASPGSKYDRYDLTVDHYEGDRATEIKLCSFKRPHMRGLHCAWISFFFAFMVCSRSREGNLRPDSLSRYLTLFCFLFRYGLHLPHFSRKFEIFSVSPRQTCGILQLPTILSLSWGVS
jgi:hypothetical protein